MADLEDWIVLDDGIPIGRIYQRHAPANADVAWFWSITTYVEPRSGLRTSGTTETLDAAKVAFRDNWDKMASLGNEGRVRLRAGLTSSFWTCCVGVSGGEQE
jgi:hypothetical protein